MTASTVNMTGINKRYGSKQVIDDVHLAIEKGQIYGLIGPSGAGKTTLVKMMVGMEKTDSGQVIVLGTKMPNVEMLQHIGYMAQADALYTELTGAENLAFFASLFKLSRMQQKERIAYTAQLVQLTEHLNERVANYSGGMKRRLSLAIALIQNPPLLILDEPTVGIDPKLRLSIWEELRRLCDEEGKSIIITTHVMDEAAKCDQLAMIRDGKVIVSGSPQSLMAQYEASNLETVFLQAGEAK